MSDLLYNFTNTSLRVEVFPRELVSDPLNNVQSFLIESFRLHRLPYKMECD